MVSKAVIKAIVMIAVVVINIFAITIVTIGVDASPFYFVAMVLTFTAGILIGWDF